MVPFGNFGWNFGVGFGWILVIISLVLVAFGIVQLIRFMSGPPSGTNPSEKIVCDETALDALKRRYARGEISKDEFEKMKRDIEPAQDKAA